MCWRILPLKTVIVINPMPHGYASSLATTVPVPLAENRPSGTPPEEDIGMSGTTSDPKNAGERMQDLLGNVEAHHH